MERPVGGLADQAVISCCYDESFVIPLEGWNAGEDGSPIESGMTGRIGRSKFLIVTPSASCSPRVGGFRAES